MNIYFILGLYIVFSILILTKLKPHPYNFSFLFFSYTFIAYFIGFFIFRTHPELSVLIPLPQNRSNVFFNSSYYNDTFLIFLIGMICFYIPFFIIRNFKIKKFISIRFNISFLSAFILFLIFNFASFCIRKYFNVGIPTTVKTNSKIAEYCWYLFDYTTLILLILTIYKGLSSKHLIKYYLSLLSFFIYGVSLILLGWKIGFIWGFLFLFHILFYIIFNNQSLRHRLSKLLVLCTILFTLGLPIIFVLSNAYRVNINSNKIFEVSTFKSRVIQSSQTAFTSRNLIYIYNRVTGISALFPTIAYESPNKENEISFWNNLLTRGSYQPETYFGCNIIKCETACPPSKTAYAPTGWGVFYIYHRTLGVAIGFLILGFIFSILEKVLPVLISENENIIALYTVTYAIIFPAMVFEGTIVFFFKRHVLSFILAFLIIGVGAKLINRIQFRLNQPDLNK